MAASTHSLIHRLKLRLAMGDEPSPDAVNIPGIEWIRDPHKQAFVRAIAEHPNDDAPKLILADYLDEQGDSATAARIRWYVNALRTQFTPESLQQHAAEFGTGNAFRNHQSALYYHFGNEGGSTERYRKLGLYNSLYHRLMSQLYPIDWSQVVPTAAVSADAIRKNLDGAHLTNELVGLGVLPENYAGYAERQAYQVPNAFAGIGNQGSYLERAILRSSNAASSNALHIRGYTQLGNTNELIFPSSASSQMATRVETHNNPHEHPSNTPAVLATGLALHPHWRTFPEEYPITSSEELPSEHSENMQMSASDKLRRLIQLHRKTADTPLRLDYYQPRPNITPQPNSYEPTATAVANLFGHDPEALAAWLGVHSNLPVNIPPDRRAYLASVITSRWVNARKPTEPYQNDTLVGGVLSDPNHPDHLDDPIHPKHPINEIALNVSKVLQRESQTKEPEFGGTPLDTHLYHRITHPSFEAFKRRSDVLRQLPGADPTHQLPARSDLTRHFEGHPEIRDVFHRLDAHMGDNPEAFWKYRQAVHDAAQQLGWTPDQVQESVYTSLLGLVAQQKLGVPPEEVINNLKTHAIFNNWTPHESATYPQLAHTFRSQGIGVLPSGSVETGKLQRAAEGSRPGILFVRHNAGVPSGPPRVTSNPIQTGMRKRLEEHGLIDPRTGQVRQFRREEQPLRLMAKYDRPIDFGPALDRVLAANQGPLIEGLKQVFLRSGINPQYIAPAVHDQGGLTRASVVAIGQASNPNSRMTGTAWVGLLGRQPGMLSFRGNPHGKDSIYVFHHHNADIVRNVLQNAGVLNRTIVPEANHYKVYVYDPGNKYRGAMAKALSDLRAQATEWRGDGKPVGGAMEDMGRSQYRSVINASES